MQNEAVLDSTRYLYSFNFSNDFNQYLHDTGQLIWKCREAGGMEIVTIPISTGGTWVAHIVVLLMESIGTRGLAITTRFVEL